MTTLSERTSDEYIRNYWNQWVMKGEAKGEAKALLAVLDARGIEVPDAIHDRITKCTDSDQLMVWIRRAATIEKIQDLDEQFVDAR